MHHEILNLVTMSSYIIFGLDTIIFQKIVLFSSTISTSLQNKVNVQSERKYVKENILIYFITIWGGKNVFKLFYIFMNYCSI